MKKPHSFESALSPLAKTIFILLGEPPLKTRSKYNDPSPPATLSDLLVRGSNECNQAKCENNSLPLFAPK